MPLDPQASDLVKQQVASNQQSADDRAAKLHAEAAEKSKSSLTNAVSHLNRQTERGPHDPALGWGTAETQP